MSCGTCHVHVDPSWLTRLIQWILILWSFYWRDLRIMMRGIVVCLVKYITDKLDGLTLNLVDDNKKISIQHGWFKSNFQSKL